MFRWIRNRLARRRFRDTEPFTPWDRVPFEQSLSETQAWCGMPDRVDPRASLRSHELMPFLLYPNPAVVVHHVVKQRGYRLQDWHGGTPYRSPAPTPGGRLLVFYPWLNLTDGAAEQASDGFFDIWNVPPWDTWVAYGVRPTTPTEASRGSFLICWVPPRFVDHADRGVEINPEQCIAWLDDPTLARLLDDAGLP